MHSADFKPSFSSPITSFKSRTKVIKLADLKYSNEENMNVNYDTLYSHKPLADVTPEVKFNATQPTKYLVERGQLKDSYSSYKSIAKGMKICINFDLEPVSSIDHDFETKFKLAEKLFVPKFDQKTNWYSKDYVDELQKFYQQERDSLKSRMDRIYQENDEVKLSLYKQLDDLKLQLKDNIESHNLQIKDLEQRNQREVTRIITEKDTLINKLQDQVADLKLKVRFYILSKIRVK